jgi:hypothetical protein
MDTFFNELSVKEATDKDTTLRWMSTLVKIYKKVISLGFKELKTTTNFANLTIAPNYRFKDWLQDPIIDRDTRLLFLTKVSKSPFIETLLAKKSGETQQLHEFKYKKHNAAGLGAAYLFDSLALSLDNSDEWDTHIINLDITGYCAEEEQIIQKVGEVKHSSRAEHLDFLVNWIEERKKFDITDGKLLWLKRKEIFPYLVFCDSTEKQLVSLLPGQPEFPAVIKRLSELDKYCSTWGNGTFTTENYHFSKATPESDSRLAKYKDVFTILCPDGSRRLFSRHVRYTPGAGRVHFFPDSAKKIIYVGYIGSKIS